jgi:hypothetical protein
VSRVRRAVFGCELALRDPHTAMTAHSSDLSGRPTLVVQPTTEDAAEAVPNQSERRETRLGLASRAERPRWEKYSSLIVFWAAFLTSNTCVLIRERSLFSVPHYAWGDAGVNSLLAVRAEHFRGLVGNYSRVGFHHPGPALIDMLASGEVFFRDILHVVPAPYNGQLLGVSLYVSLFLSLAVLTLYRMTKSVPIACIAFGLGFLFDVRQDLFADDWFPILYISAFLLFVVAAAGVAAGRTSDLPCYVLASGTLIHGHVSFLLFVGVTTAAAGTSWYLLHRGDVPTEAGAHRTAVFGAAAIVGLFLLPMVLEVLLHFPGPWRQYWSYVGHAKLSHRSLIQVLHYEWHYWKDLHIPLALYPIAIMIGLGLTLTEPNREFRRLFVSIYGILCLETALTLYYLLRGVDILTPESVYSYVGYFYETVPLLLLIAAASQVWLRFRSSAAQSSPSLALRGGASLIALAAVALTLIGATNPILGRLPDPQSNVVPLVSALRESPDRGKRPIALVEDSLSDWPVAAAIAVELQRTGVPWCLWRTMPMDVVLYTPAFVCSGSMDRLWTVHVSGASPLPMGTVLWKGSLGDDPHTVIYATQ